MVKRSTAETQDWDDERIALRIRLRLAEERGDPVAIQRELTGRITELGKKIAAGRGIRSDG